MLTKPQLKDIARIISEKIFFPYNNQKTTIFLCGANKKDTKKGRFKLSMLFKENNNFELIYPEDIFEDLLEGQGRNSLLWLENTLAESVDVIIIIPESPGSFAELGAFSANQILVNKTICIADKKFMNEKSFLRYGPFRLIKQSESGAMMYENYESFLDKEKGNNFIQTLSKKIDVIKKNSPTEKNTTNILELKNFILPSIYLIDNLTIHDLFELVENTTSKDRRYVEIATRSAITQLTVLKLIENESNIFKASNNGQKYLQDNFKMALLDRTRVEIMNLENRRKSAINHDRI